MSLSTTIFSESLSCVDNLLFISESFVRMVAIFQTQTMHIISHVHKLSKNQRTKWMDFEWKCKTLAALALNTLFQKIWVKWVMGGLIITLAQRQKTKENEMSKVHSKRCVSMCEFVLLSDASKLFSVEIMIWSHLNCLMARGLRIIFSRIGLEGKRQTERKRERIKV